MKPIITSPLDTDFYKISMQQCVFHQYPTATARYTFKCRNKGIQLGFLAYDVREQIMSMTSLSLSKEEEQYLGKIPFISADYLEYLKSYRFDYSKVNVCSVNGELVIEIGGTWVETILWEVPLLAIVNQLYFEATSDFRTIRGIGEQRLKDKINLIRQYPRFTFADFGTRRRYSVDWQRHVVETLHKYCPQLIGTSNVKLAMELGIKPIGTMAHEYISAHLALTDNVRQAQRRALYVWLQEYINNLGIALTDTFTTEAFYKDFNIVLANAFSGVRQDSGDPIEFGNRMIQHYKSLGIDPRTKSIVFSDGLDVPKAIEIYKEFTGSIGLSFGIGTNLTNDVGADPLNIVIKMIECNGKPVVKLSDNPTKAIGNKDVIDKIKKSYQLVF